MTGFRYDGTTTDFLQELTEENGEGIFTIKTPKHHDDDIHHEDTKPRSIFNEAIPTCRIIRHRDFASWLNRPTRKEIRNCSLRRADTTTI